MDQRYEIELAGKLRVLRVHGVTGYKLNAKQQQLMVGLELNDTFQQAFSEGRPSTWLNDLLIRVQEKVIPVLREYVEGEIQTQFTKDDWGHFEEDGSGGILIFSWKA